MTSLSANVQNLNLKTEREKILYEESVKMATEEEKQRRKNLGIGNVKSTFDDIVMLVTKKSVANYFHKNQILEEPSVNVTNVSNSSNDFSNVTKCPEERKISLEHKICDLLPDMDVSLRN